MYQLELEEEIMSKYSAAEIEAIYNKAIETKEVEIDENTIKNRLNYFIEKGLSKKDATEVVADEYKINKNIVYKLAIE